MKLKGLTQEEIFILTRNIGNQDTGIKATHKPFIISELLDKAVDSGNSEEEIAKVLNLESTTMFYRHKYIFRNLIADLHEKVIYGSSELKKERVKEGYITFQVANELSRIKADFQLKIYKFISENNIHGWNDTKSIRELLEINQYKNLENVLEEIIKRKGLDKRFRIGDRVDLSILNEKLIKLTQIERDKKFLKICSDIFQDEIYSVSLGYVFYEIVFKKEKIKLGQEQISENKKQILESIKNLK